MLSRALNLMVGASLKIEPENGDSCYLVELIGYMTGQSLMVTPAYGDDSVSMLKEGDKLAVRYLGSDKSYAFYSKVIYVCDKPYPYLHLEYPKGVQGLSARRASRVPIEGPVMRLSICDGNRRLSVTMADISTHGARFISSSRLGGRGDEFVIEMPDIGQAGGKALSLPCVVRHVCEQYPDAMGVATTFHHGVEFDHLDEAAQLFIARFIKDSITRTGVR